MFNLGTGTEISVGEVAKRVLALLDRDLPIVTSSERLRPPASEVERLVSDYSKAKTVLEWTPETEFQDGLRRTISWIERFLGLYKARIYNV